MIDGSAKLKQQFNPLPPSDAVRKQKKIIFLRIFSVLSHFIKYHPSENHKFNNLGIFQSLKLRILAGKNQSNFSQLKFHSKYFGLLWVNIPKDLSNPDIFMKAYFTWSRLPGIFPQSGKDSTCSAIYLSRSSRQ